MIICQGNRRSLRGVYIGKISVPNSGQRTWYVILSLGPVDLKINICTRYNNIYEQYNFNLKIAQVYRQVRTLQTAVLGLGYKISPQFIRCFFLSYDFVSAFSAFLPLWILRFRILYLGFAIDGFATRLHLQFN